MARYRYLVADLVSGVIREEMPFGGVSFESQLGGGASFNGNIGLYNPKATKLNLAVNETSVYVERDDVIVWSGFINGAPVQPGQSITINAIGYKNYFERRLIKVNKQYPNTDKLFIVRDLVNYAQSVANGNIGIQVGNELSGITTNLVIPAHERKSVMSIFDQLSANTYAAGFDYAFEAAWEGSGAARAVVKRLKLWVPRRGVTNQIALKHGESFKDYSYSKDGSSQETSVDGFGPGEGANAIILNASDPNAFNPVFDGVGSFKDVTDPNVLWWMTLVRLYARKQPRETITITIRPDSIINFGTFSLGDYVSVSLNDGEFVDVDGLYRIDSTKVDVSDDGEETITFTLLNPFVYYAGG